MPPKPQLYRSIFPFLAFQIRCTHHNGDVNGDEDPGEGEGTGGRIDWAKEGVRWRAGK